MTALIVAWQDQVTRRWLPVARLSRRNSSYVFVYTNGALESERFRPFGQLMELDAEYCSDQLFAFFANRLMSKSRPEFSRYLKWLGISNEDGVSDIDMLSRSAGMRASEGISIFRQPEKTSDNLFEITFFSNGIRYLEPNETEAMLELEPGTELHLVLENDNPADPEAVLVCRLDSETRLGWVPRYLAPDLRALVELGGKQDLIARAVQVNHDAPSQMRLLCRLAVPWPDGFEPFGGRLFQPVVSHDGSVRELRIA